MKSLRKLLGGSERPPTADSAHASSRNVVSGRERSYRNGRPAAEAVCGPGTAHVKSAAGQLTAPVERYGTGNSVRTAPDSQERPHAVPPAPPATAADVRASSLPQPLGQSGQQPQASGSSGPGAPVSPDPSAAQALRRASSTPGAGGLSHTSMASSQSCSSAADDPGSSKEGSRRSQLSAVGSVAIDAPCHAAAAPAGVASVAPPACAAEPGTRGPTAPRRRYSSPPPAPMWHPALGPLPTDLKTPAWAQRRRAQQQDRQAQGQSVVATPLTTTTPPPPAPLARPAEGGSSSRSAAGNSASHGSVSLLTSQLRGASAASSLAASRENSIRSGTKRQPGGLSLALSRENSLRGGAAREGSARGERERSVRDGSSRGISARDSSQRSVSLRSGGGRQEGSVLAQWGAAAFGTAPTAPASSLQQNQQCPPAAGCGSGEWMGLAPVSETLGSPQPLLRLDPFAGAGALAAAAAAASLGSSCAFDDFMVQAPGRAEVGSWADRVTTFSCQPGSEGAAPAPQPGTCGPDPMKLTAALQALVVEPCSLHSAACFGAASGPGCNVLVGDSELALTGSSELPSLHLASHTLHGSSRTTHPKLHSSHSLTGLHAAVLSVSAGRAVPAAQQLSCSWDPGHGGGMCPPLPMLGGSAPTAGLGPIGSGLSDTAGRPGHRRTGSQPLGCEVTAATQEWNRSFMKRWREVKKRAYLQGLGLRALWRVHSLSDRHEPLELLTNDLPQCDNGMRRAWSVTRLMAQREEAHRGTPSAHLAAGRRPSLHKDPSLAAMLLGEVAEVC